MVAGLFAAHGVFFGRCRGPARINAKGFFENEWLKRTMHRDLHTEGWPRPWFDELQRQGWDGESPWGAKLMPKWWERMQHTGPAVAVCCFRPDAPTLRSCQAVRWRRSSVTLRQRQSMMDAIQAPTVVRVDTERVVDGDCSQLVPAFEALGLEFDQEIATEWVDPKLWHFR